MPEFKIRKFPDLVLRKKSAKIDRITDLDRQMLSEMAKTMYLNQGVGLAAIQVGIDKQLAVIDIGNGLIKMVNPVIVKKMGAQTQEEGCLSVPGASVKIKRARKVLVSFLNEKGEVMQLEAEGLLARAIQHELDHLSGRLIIDHLNPIQRILFRKKISKNAVIK